MFNLLNKVNMQSYTGIYNVEGGKFTDMYCTW